MCPYCYGLRDGRVVKHVRIQQRQGEIPRIEPWRWDIYGRTRPPRRLDRRSNVLNFNEFGNLTIRQSRACLTWSWTASLDRRTWTSCSSRPSRLRPPQKRCRDRRSQTHLHRSRRYTAWRETSARTESDRRHFVLKLCQTPNDYQRHFILHKTIQFDNILVFTSISKCQ